MPPRRSCFHDGLESDLVAQPSFNATTAFLLRFMATAAPSGSTSFQCHHGVPASAQFCDKAFFLHVLSMPPRRSCFPQVIGVGLLAVLPFNATTAFLLRGLLRPPNPGGTQFQCHHGVPASFLNRQVLVRRSPRFQCHHGVPASFKRSQLADRAFWDFNATTAFLLPWSPPPPPSWGCGISMPPRRSCFAEGASSMVSPLMNFNATTAFLLPGGVV